MLKATPSYEPPRRGSIVTVRDTQPLEISLTSIHILAVVLLQVALCSREGAHANGEPTHSTPVAARNVVHWEVGHMYLEVGQSPRFVICPLT